MYANNSTVDAHSDEGAADLSEEPLGSSLSDSTYEIISQSSFHTSDSEAEDGYSSDNDDCNVSTHGDESGHLYSLEHTISHEDHTFSSDDDYDENDNGIALQSTLTTRENLEQAEVSLQIPSPSMSSMSHIEAPIDFRQSLPSLIDTSASGLEDNLSSVHLKNCKFEEPPSTFQKDYVDVKHTVTSNFGWLSDSSTALTIRQSMTAHAFRCKSPFRILYHGHPDFKELIIEKIASALAITGDSEEDKADVSIKSYVVSEPGVGTAGSNVGGVQNLSSGLSVIVEDCSKCACTVSTTDNERGRSVKLHSLAILSLQKEKLASYKARAVVSRSDKLASRGFLDISELSQKQSYAWPDLAIVTHKSPGSSYHDNDWVIENPEHSELSQTPRFLHVHSKQFKEIGIPTLDILEQPAQSVEVRADQFFHLGKQEALHMCVELHDGSRASPNFALKRFPIDIVAFMKIDPSQLNRHIACILQVYSNGCQSKYGRAMYHMKAAEESFKRTIQRITERTRAFLKVKATHAINSFQETNDRFDAWPNTIISVLLLGISCTVLVCLMQRVYSSVGSLPTFGNLGSGSQSVHEMTTVYETITVTPLPVMTGSPVFTGLNKWKSQAELIWSDIGRSTGLISDKHGEQKLYWKGVQFKVQQSNDGRILLLVSGREGKAWKPLPGRIFIQYGENAAPKPATLRSVEPGVFEMLLPQVDISQKLLIGVFPDPLEDVFVTFSFDRADSKSAHLKRPRKAERFGRSIQHFYTQTLENVLSTYRKSKSSVSNTTAANKKRFDGVIGDLLDKMYTQQRRLIHATANTHYAMKRLNPRQHFKGNHLIAETYFQLSKEALLHLKNNLLERRNALGQISSQIQRKLSEAHSRINSFNYRAYFGMRKVAARQAMETRDASLNTIYIVKSAVQSARERLLSLKSRFSQQNSVAERKAEYKFASSKRKGQRISQKKNKRKLSE